MRKDLVNKSRSLAGNSDLTLFAAIKPEFAESLESVSCKTRIKRLLQTLNGGRSSAFEYALLRPFSDAVERIGRIHSVRVVVVEPENKVLLAATFEGTWEAYIRVLWQKVPTLLDIIFCDTVDYVTAADHRFEEWEAWARRVQVETQFFYATPRLTVDDVRYLRHEEQLRRRCPVHADTDVQAMRHKLASVEELAWEAAGGTSGAASFEAIKQGLESLAALYRLTELYPRGTDAGRLLQRAARHLLLEFATLRERDEIPPVLKRAMERFKVQLAWFDEDPLPSQDLQRLQTTPPGKEPVFDHDDVQGGIVTTYPDVTHGCMLMLAIDDRAKAVAFFEKLPGQVTREPPYGPRPASALAVNVAFTYEGLRAMGLSEDELALFPLEFREGMEARAGMLGDARANHPRRWRLPCAFEPASAAAPQPAAHDEPRRIELSAVHIVLQLRLASGQPDAPWGQPWEAGHPLQPAFDHWKQEAADGGLRLLAVQPLQRLFNSQRQTTEHFGYADGANGSDPWITRQDPGRVYPNQVHLGEILVGYPNEADAAPAQPLREADRASFHARMKWLHNGSFLVVRKLAQDVQAFNAAVAHAARQPGLNAALVRQKMMGRQDDGKPLMPAFRDSNDFDYSSDPQGSVCPFHAHIRRANPRQTETGFNELPGRRTPRIVRRGMSYGPAYTEGVQDERTPAERGMVFMAYNASIGEQFEVIQGWLSAGNSSGSYSGQSDPLMGVAENGQQRRFRFELDHPGSPSVVSVALDGNDAVLGERRPFVRLEWGAYLFTPSIKALGLLQQSLEAAGSTPKPKPVWSKEEGVVLIEALQAVADEQGKDAARAAWKVALEDPVEQESFRAASIWAAIREERGGVLNTPYGMLLASPDKVMQAFSAKKDALSVCGYHDRLKDSIGEIYLSLDDGEDYRRLSTFTNQAISNIDRPTAFALSRRLTEDQLEQRFLFPARTMAVNPVAPTRWEITLDIKELIDRVLGEICKVWFGLPESSDDIELGSWRWEAEPKKAYFPGSFTAPSRFAFQPQPAGMVERMGKEIGKTCTEAFTRFVQTGDTAAMRTAPISGAIFDDLGRGSPRDHGLVARTLVGAMMGFLPTADGNLRRVLNEWLRDGSFWRLRALWLTKTAADRQTLGMAKEVFGIALEQAMQLRPSPEMVWRTATCDEPMGLPKVKKGDTVVLGIVSATQNKLVDGDRDLLPIFGGERARIPMKVEFGPTHACPGYEAAMGVLLGFIAGLMNASDAMRASAVPLALVFEGPLQMPPPANPADGTTLTGPPPPSAAAQLVLGLGDSWLHYYATDVFDVLRYEMKLQATSFAEEGTCLTDGKALKIQLGRVDEFIVEQLKHGQQPGVVVLSAGGNDVVRERLASLLTIRDPTATRDEAIARALDASAMAAFVDDAMRMALLALAGNIDDMCRLRLGRAVPIVLHGYDHPTPDGRGPFGSTYGNWLQPAFFGKGYTSLDEGRAVMAVLIDRLNAMQLGAAAELRKAGLDIRHVDLRASLQWPADWENELHPTRAGFRLVASRLATEVLKCLPLSAPR